MAKRRRMTTNAGDSHPAAPMGPDHHDQKQRVLYVIKSLRLGGAESILSDLVNRLAGTDIDLTVAHVLGRDSGIGVRIPEDAARLVHLGRRRWIWPVVLSMLIRRGKFSVIHIHSPLPGSVARLAVRSMRSARRPLLVTTEHNSWNVYNRWTRAANTLTIRWDDRIIAVSEDARRSMTPAIAERTTVITHGVDIDSLRRASREQAGHMEPEIRSADVPLIACVANLRPAKAHDVLIDALSLMKSRRIAFQCLLVGSGPQEAIVKRLIDDRDLNDCVTMLGTRADARDIIAESDMVVLSSHIEGLPVVLMEAAALGTPIVTTAVGGIPDLFKNDHNALVVPPGDPEGLASALTRMVEDPSLRTRLAESASELLPNFDARETAAKYRTMYFAHRRR
jgi:glycosyltransferase involved in cell wall biosynthesis